MLSQVDMPPGYSLTRSTAAELDIVDIGNSRLFLGAQIDAAGVVGFEVQAVDPVDGSRGSVRGAVLFDLMVRHFGPAVTAIAGFWVDGTNLDEFNRRVAAGMTWEAAAAVTWTGRQAIRHGFATVRVEPPIGSLGRYGWVRARFSR